MHMFPVYIPVFVAYFPVYAQSNYMYVCNVVQMHSANGMQSKVL